MKYNFIRIYGTDLLLFFRCSVNITESKVIKMLNDKTLKGEIDNS